jgi:2-dehydro-3-deoxyphosphogluconate aldolase/(4S)-4-hydroxy-2-oxoglutarate aldolase
VTRLKLPDEVTGTRLVGIMRGSDTQRCMDVAAAGSDGGIRVFEITMDSPDAERTIAALVSAGHVVGAGTVLSIDDARKAVDSGAEFLVAPHTDRRIVDWAVENGHPMVPGALTPTEVMSAWDLGAAAIKIFPASVGGPALVRAMAAPLGGIPLMVTGGIDAANVASYLSAGAVAAGVGGWLVVIEDLEMLRVRAAMLVSAVENPNV